MSHVKENRKEKYLVSFSPFFPFFSLCFLTQMSKRSRFWSKHDCKSFVLGKKRWNFALILSVFERSPFEFSLTFCPPHKKAHITLVIVSPWGRTTRAASIEIPKFRFEARAAEGPFLSFFLCGSRVVVVAFERERRFEVEIRKHLFPRGPKETGGEGVW